MAADTAVIVNSPGDTVESLLKEAEALKVKLEDERLKLNDVTCIYLFYLQLVFYFFCIRYNFNVN